MSFTMQRAQPGDAVSIIRYMKHLLSEPNHNMRRDADEFRHTVGEEARAIKKFASSKNSLFLIAKAEDRVIGVLTCSGGRYRAEKHTTELGISVDQDWRGKGVGSAMMEAAVEWAQTTAQLKRITLFVLERNQDAVRLYERLGFEIEGKLRKDFYRDGVYLDTLVMGLLLP